MLVLFLRRTFSGEKGNFCLNPYEFPWYQWTPSKIIIITKRKWYHLSHLLLLLMPRMLINYYCRQSNNNSNIQIHRLENMRQNNAQIDGTRRMQMMSCVCFFNCRWLLPLSDNEMENETSARMHIAPHIHATTRVIMLLMLFLRKLYDAHYLEMLPTHWNISTETLNS